MKFYRPLSAIKAMTFDLDDTLYDNYPVIRRTTLESHAALQAFHPALRDFTPQDYQQLRDAEATAGAAEVMAVFHQWRSQVEMPDETHQTLKTLAEKIPLVAVTNGNACPEKMGIAEYFRFTLRAGPDGRAKPWQDMYQLAAQRLDIAPHHILHVGDDLTTDVAGSLRCGLQACWINLRQGNLMHIPDARLLPHVEISRLASLTSLL